MLLARALPAAKIPASSCHLYLFTAPKGALFSSRNLNLTFSFSAANLFCCNPIVTLASLERLIIPIRFARARNWKSKMEIRIYQIVQPAVFNAAEWQAFNVNNSFYLPQSLSEKWELACGGAFARALRWLVPYSPLWGCAERSASRTAKIPRRRPFPIFQTDSQRSSGPDRQANFLSA